MDKALHRDLAAIVKREFVVRAALTTGPLTGLLNRHGFEAQAGQVLTLCRRLRLRAAPLCIDLDGFKSINDGCGQPAVALRGSDIAARLGSGPGAAGRGRRAARAAAVRVQRRGRRLPARLAARVLDGGGGVRRAAPR